ncbi:MAG: hypothetical protein LUC16_01445, partial [Coprobacillus sp.]|nr:hypothetical protein [Coprobacillus sp.]
MISFLNFLPSSPTEGNVARRLKPFLDETEELIIEKLLNLYLSRFSYEGLPDEMQETIGSFNYLDAVLFFNPSGCFCKTAQYGIQYLPTT